MDGFLIQGWDLILTGWRWLHEPQVGVCTLCGAVSTRETTVLVPGLLELQMDGRIYDAGMGPYPAWVALATPSWGFYTVRDGSDPGVHRFRPQFVSVVDVWKDF